MSQKRRERPPLLETDMEYFDQGGIALVHHPANVNDSQSPALKVRSIEYYQRT
jgi:hypothetical protein